ncbi:glycosyltransferase family 39 protein [Candidatus Pelagibacter sp.]|nr:glycosyltransferase family 39 protein [Candidatus Pelagibacter sp.]MDC3163758.1 glycosyltransferase family 39 protein [Candidatus Pelagibacter sp.]
MAINKRNINNIFYIFVTTHLILWTVVPTITNSNLPLDTIEALAWGSNLDWGFNKHPPLSAFFPEIFFQIFGPQDWAYYFLSQLFVVISFFIIFKLSEEILNDGTLSLLSVFLIEGIYFYNFTTPEFNVNVCQLPFWCLTVYFAWKIYKIKKVELYDCILLGATAALGILSKYLFIYLLIAIDLLFAYLIFFKKSKKFDFKYIVSLEVFFVILIPHLIWLFNNDFITVKYGFARAGLDEGQVINHLKYPLIFTLKQIGILIPFLFLVWLLIKKIPKKLNFKDEKLLFLIFINLVPIILIFMTALITGSKIRTMWMTPFYLFFGTFFIYIFKTQINLKKLNTFLIGFLFIFLLSPFLYGYVSISNTDKRTDYPGKDIAIKVQIAWHEQNDEPIKYVLGDEWVAGNLSYHINSRPIWKGFVTKEKLNSFEKYMCIDKICVGS